MNSFMQAYNILKLANSDYVHIGNHFYEIIEDITTSNSDLLDPADVAEIEGIKASDIIEMLGGVYFLKQKKHVRHTRQ